MDQRRGGNPNRDPIPRATANVIVNSFACQLRERCREPNSCEPEPGRVTLIQVKSDSSRQRAVSHRAASSVDGDVDLLSDYNANILGYIGAKRQHTLKRWLCARSPFGKIQ